MINLKKRFWTVTISLVTLLLTFDLQAQILPAPGGGALPSAILYPTNFNNNDCQSVGIDGCYLPNGGILSVASDETPTKPYFSIERFKRVVFGPVLVNDPNPTFRLQLDKTYFIVKQNGNVGVGTANPVQKMHINGGNLRIQSISGYADFGSFNGSWFHFVTDRDKFYFNKEIRVNSGNIGSYTGNLNLRTEGTTRMTINSTTGNVGVGIPVATEKFHVVGTSLFVGTSEFTERVQIGDKTITSGTHNTSDLKLTVDGNAIFKKVIVTQSNWADFVFDENYKLTPLTEVEAFVKKEKHLPAIPSEQEVLEEGIEIGEMNKLLLLKIEEMTLYMIQMQKEIDELKNAGE